MTDNPVLIQNWRSRKADISIYSIITIVLLLLGYLGRQRASFIAVVAFFAVVMYLVYLTLHSIMKYSHDYLVAPVSNDIALEIVTNVVQEKSIPFSIHDHIIVLDGTNLEIHIDSSHTGPMTLFYRGMRSVISIGPKTSENCQLVNTLVTRIADGFKLAGLK